MDHERRKVIPPRRYEMLEQLTAEQRFELRRYEQYGWELQFVRHPVFDRPVPLLKDRASGELAYHVLDVMQAFDDASQTGKHIDIGSRPAQPAALPLGPLPGNLDA